MQLQKLHASLVRKAGRAITADRSGRLAPAAPAAEGELGLGNPGWQRRHAVFALHTSFRERVLLAALAPAARALLHSQSGPGAGMWLAAIPSDVACTLAPDGAAFGCPCPSHTRTTCCPGAVSSLKGLYRWLSRTTAPQVHPDGPSPPTSLSTEQRATAKLCAAMQPSPPLLALAALSPVPTRGRESRLSRRADAKSRATRS